MAYYDQMTSPIGELLLVGDGERLTGLYLRPSVPSGRIIDNGRRDRAAFQEVRQQLVDYFAHRRDDFDLELRLHGTAFQRRVWQTLRAIPYGQTASYRWVAEQIGAPSAVRAVGGANRSNPISIIIPCHRVIGSNGDLIGYGGGLTRKQWLLDHETQPARCSPASRPTCRTPDTGRR